jgi:hypothetical protein
MGHAPLPIFLHNCDLVLLTFHLDPEGDWTAHKVELALWTEVIARKYDFDLSQKPHVNGCGNGVHSGKRKAEEEPGTSKEKVKKVK